MTYLKAFGRFWYDFVIGDDWKIAVGVVAALALTWALVAWGWPDAAVTVTGVGCVLAAFTVVLLIDTRRKRRPGG